LDKASEFYLLILNDDVTKEEPDDVDNNTNVKTVVEELLGLFGAKPKT
jgi:hypothetical protein